ncbi:endonuclease/exonuclease/phosphatase family protein [Yoonia sp. 2307UL14-13]|uniref:endonuclease/exonuclease/phosphatase family protein n=1 Tax=Yoonia sp. 2307UL14-13 TaxID=3126506 RepID=UPI00309ECBF8
MIGAILKTIIFLVTLLALTACVQHIRNSGSSALPSRVADTLRIATYNVHYIWLGRATGPWSVGDWERRKGPLDQAFKALDADVVAFQEMESFARGSDGSVNLTLDWLLENNPGYGAAAVGDWEVFPSTQPIFYRADRLSAVDQGWFFFSDTPDVIYSRTFNGSFPAFASWAAFVRADGRRFRVVNVHFEYSSGSNRLLSAELVADRIGPWVADGETVFLVGDLNARLGAPTVEILEGAGLTFAPVQGSTYHFNRGINLFGAIDHIAVTEGADLARAPVVLREKFAGEWPTDHYPVIADYRLP